MLPRAEHNYLCSVIMQACLRCRVMFNGYLCHSLCMNVYSVHSLHLSTNVLLDILYLLAACNPQTGTVFSEPL